MSCFTNYINLDESIPSRSGLYAGSLPGIDSEMIDGIAKEGKEDETWDILYKRAYDGLVAEVRKLVNNKFKTDLKLVARETSVFKESVNAGGLSGVQIGFNLPKYARIHVISIGVNSAQEYETPDVPFYVYEEDENGELLYEASSEEIVSGRNTINVDQDFDVDKIFVAYDSNLYSFLQTENKKYSHYLSWSCDECRFDCGGYEGTVKQINGGGLNVKYTVYCSIEKFVCENINLFAQSLLWKIGIVITEERRFGERLNKFTTMTLERAEELMTYYTEKFNLEVVEVIKGQSIREDEFCFPCKHLVSKRTSLP